MHKCYVSLASLQFLLVVEAAAQPAPNSLPSLSLDQQNKISEIVTNRTPQPLTHINFALQRDALVPADIALQRLPAQAESLAPELKGYSYLAVEEIGRCRRYEFTKSCQRDAAHAPPGNHQHGQLSD
ncbi:MAG TPA: hypothetical protein VK522_12820 [Pseudolabrys sp.]|nr:hypothetical protein [Pseudolabrys sp.]